MFVLASKGFIMTNRLLLKSPCRSLLGLVLFFAGALLSAQAQTGSIRGTVADPSGAVVPSATVTLTSASGASRFALSGGDGAFVIDQLDSGSYTLSANAEGFAPFDPLQGQIAAA